MLSGKIRLPQVEKNLLSACYSLFQKFQCPFGDFPSRADLLRYRHTADGQTEEKNRHKREHNPHFALFQTELLQAWALIT
jgi:hypothetical protein